MHTKRRVGRTPLSISPVGFGGGPLGNLFTRVVDGTARAALDAAWERGFRHYDTSPFYGFGLSERRVGDALRDRPWDEWTLSTKVGRILRPQAGPPKSNDFFRDALAFDFDFDYSYDGVRRSVDESFQRLGLNRIDVLLLHDLDPWAHADDNRAVVKTAFSSGYRALDELRAAGTVKAIGLGVGSIELCMQALDHGDYDCFLLAAGYTLLDQRALDALLPACSKRSVSLMIGAPYHSGILASGTVPGAKHGYRNASPEAIEHVSRFERVASAYGVPLGALAIQFPLGHPCVASVLPGIRSPDEAHAAANFAAATVPPSLWSDLKSEGLIRPDSVVPLE